LGLLQRVLAKALPQVDRRIDWRVDRKLEERVLPELPKQAEALSGLSGDLSSVSEKLLFTMSELRRWMVDDLEAANETTMLLGESLTRIQSTLDRFEGEIAAIGQRLDRLEAQAAASARQ
jgi:chromosome segregation ATPase